MPEFLTLVDPREAVDTLLAALTREIKVEQISSWDSLGRTVAKDILAPHSLPTFRRSTVDGYAVRARDTFGASENLPMYLDLVGEIPMGNADSYPLLENQCYLIHTGGMVPEDANSIVMLEYTQKISDVKLEVYRPVSEGENTIQIGEDVYKGEVILENGKVIGPEDIGALAALGIIEVEVYPQLTIGIISSGDEVISPGDEMGIGQVRDINSYSLSALMEKHGVHAVRYGIVKDDFLDLLSVAQKAKKETDLVVFTAGSSASARDLTAKVINEMGKPGLLVHGLNVRPGKPTIFGCCDNVPVLGLPGNPVSAILIARLILMPIINFLSGSVVVNQPKIIAEAKLSVNIPSESGREDFLPVKLIKEKESLVAEPIFGKSNLIFTLVRADGLVRISTEQTGLHAGEIVSVFEI